MNVLTRKSVLLYIRIHNELKLIFSSLYDRNLFDFDREISVIKI